MWTVRAVTGPLFDLYCSLLVLLCALIRPYDYISADVNFDGHAYYSSTFVRLTLGGYNYGVMMALLSVLHNPTCNLPRLSSHCLSVTPEFDLADRAWSTMVLIPVYNVLYFRLQLAQTPTHEKRIDGYASSLYRGFIFRHTGCGSTFVRLWFWNPVCSPPQANLDHCLDMLSAISDAPCSVAHLQ